MTHLPAAAALVTLLALPAAAQDFTGLDITGLFMDGAIAMQGQMDQVTGGIVASNLGNPQVMAAYQQAIASGRYYGTPEQFAYDYAATGGFSPIGMQRYMGTSTQIHQDFQTGMAGLQQSGAAYDAAINGWTGGFGDIQHEGGLGLMGQSTYQGETWNAPLPHTWQPNSSHDWQGHSFDVDSSGQYWHFDAWTGTWVPVYR